MEKKSVESKRASFQIFEPSPDRGKVVDEGGGLTTKLIED